jgi:hypothetical protein
VEVRHDFVEVRHDFVEVRHLCECAGISPYLSVHKKMETLQRMNNCQKVNVYEGSLCEVKASSLQGVGN